MPCRNNFLSIVCGQIRRKYLYFPRAVVDKFVSLCPNCCTQFPDKSNESGPVVTLDNADSINLAALQVCYTNLAAVQVCYTLIPTSRLYRCVTPTSRHYRCVTPTSWPYRCVSGVGWCVTSTSGLYRCVTFV